MNKPVPPIGDTYDFGPPPPQPRETLWEKLYRFFFGDDVFISYARSDAIRYVPRLAARLAAEKYICFFDQLVADPNEDLPETLKKKILRSTVFILIGTKSAVSSPFVRKEIELFRRTRRPFIPIDVDGALVDPTDWREVIGVAKIREEGARVHAGDPSPEVVNLIKDSFRYTRRSQWLRISLLAGVGVIFITAAVSLLVLRAARAEATIRKRQADSEVATANKEVSAAKQILQNLTVEVDRLKTDANAARNEAKSAAASAEVAVTQQRAAEQAMRRAQELERQATERAAETSRREAGSRAALLSRAPGREPDALSLAVEAAEQSIASHGDFPDEVMEGVAAAVDAVDYSLPLEGAGETDFDSYLISPNGEKILGTFSNSRTGSTKLTLWDARTGKRTSDAKRPGSLGMSSFSRDGKRLALVFFGTPRNDLLIWDLTGPQVRPVGTLCGPSGNDGFTITVALDSDGSHIIIGESKGSGHSHVTICEIATGRKEVVTSLQVVNDAAFTPEDEPALYGRVAAYGPDNLPPVVYFPRTGQKVAVKLSSDPNTAKFSGFGDDGSIIIIARTYNEAAQDRVYVQSTNGDVRRLAGYRGAVNAAAFVAGEGLVVTVSGRKARVADVRRSRNFAALRAHARSLDLVAFSPDDRTILTVGDDGKARLWDAQTGSLLHTLAVTDEVLYEGQPPYNRHKYAAFQPDGTRLVTVNEKGDIQTWDVSTGRPGCSVPGPGPDNKDYPSNVSFLAGGGYLLTAYYRSTTKSVFINFLDARTCRLVRSLDFDEQISFVSVSPDGTAMITGTYPDPAKFDNPDLKLWSLRGLDLRSGGPIRLSTPSVIRLPGPLRGFSFDGTRMVTVTEDGAGQMLVSGGNLPVRLKQWPRDTVGQGYFILSANGARAAGITQSKAWVWDTRSGELLLSFEWDLYLAPGTVSLSSDGSKLIIAGKDNTVRIYPTSREGFLRAARRLLGR